MIDLAKIHFQIAPSSLFAADNAGENGHCAACGRALKDGAGYTVCVAEGGEILVGTRYWDDDAVVTDSGYMGLFDLGPECARTIKPSYKAKR